MQSMLYAIGLGAGSIPVSDLKVKGCAHGEH